MASDSLNEVGKYLKNTRKDTNYALKKIRPLRPPVERTRDIFDPDIPFTMYFDVTPNQKVISLDLEFNKPPPLEGCNTGDNIESFCETFEFDDSATVGPDDHEIVLSNRLTLGTVSVYVNSFVYPSSKWYIISAGDENNPGRIMVTQLPMEINTVTICYIFKTTVYNTANQFRSLIGSVDTDSGNTHSMYYLAPGTTSLAGWFTRPAIGDALEVLSNTSIGVTDNMFVRITAQAQYSEIYGNGQEFIVLFRVVLNGAIIGSDDSHITTTGLHFATDTLHVDLRNVEVRPGDIIEVYGHISGGQVGPGAGFGSAPNVSYLYVGRGNISFGYFGSWVGP